MKINTGLRAGFAAVVLIAIAACTSPGGGSSNLPAGTGAAPAGGSLGLAAKHHRKITARQRQRAIAGAALTVAGNSVNLNQFSSSSGLLSQLFDLGRAKLDRHAPMALRTPICIDGVEYSWSSSGPGEITQTIEFFYDTACTKPFTLTTVDSTYTSSGGQAKGSQETWDENGNVVAYKTFTAAFTRPANGGSGSIQVQEASAPAPSASPSSQNGFTCLLRTSNAVDCGSGNVLSLPSASPAPEELGFTQTTVGQFVTPAPSPTPGSGPSTPPTATPSPNSSPAASADWGNGGGLGGWGGPSGLQLTINGAGYTGGLGALTLAAATPPPAWAVTGGTQVVTLTGTALIGFGGFVHDHRGWHNSLAPSHRGHGGRPGPNALTSVDLKLTDSADGLTATLTSISSGKLTGTVTQSSSSQPVATISVDFSGTGTITYTNGTTEKVKDWIILD